MSKVWELHKKAKYPCLIYGMDISEANMGAQILGIFYNLPIALSGGVHIPDTIFVSVEAND